MIDVRAIPALAALAKQVAREGRAVVLREGDTDLALVSPARPVRRRRGRRAVTDADRAATLSTFGAWKGNVDPDALKQQIRESEVDDEPLPEL